MQSQTIIQAATLIADARLSGMMLESVPDDFLPSTPNEAFALLLAVNERLQLDIGGYKVGATSPSALSRTNSLGPMLGTIPRHLIKPSPAVFARADFVCPVVEFEIAFQMARPLPTRAATYSMEEVLDSTRSALVTIEIADPHIKKPFSQPIEALYADNGAAGGCVIGPDIPGWRDRELGHIEVVARANNSTTVRSVEPDQRPDALWVLHWTANACMKSGPGLQTGDYVSTGAIAAAMVLGSESQWRADFIGTGEVCVSFES